MAFQRYGTFVGGIDLPDEKHVTLGSPIRPCGRLQRLMVPLAPCGGPPARLLVDVGQYVTSGEKIAAGEGGGVNVFTPLSGKVASICRAGVAGADGFVPGLAVELVDLAEVQPIHDLPAVFDWRSADSATLIARIAEGGLTTHRSRPRRLADWVARARDKRCRYLLANVLESQPYVTANHRLLAEQGANVIRGLAILAQAMEIGQISLVVDERRTGDYHELVGPARMYGLDCVALMHKYPIGADPILIKVLTGREMPPGGSPMDVGVAVIDAATCLAAYQWVACDLPPTARVVTVAGERAGETGNFWTPFGAACRDLPHPIAGDSPDAPILIAGGPMVGHRCPPGAVVSPAVDAVLALPGAPPPLPGPCIRCGWCTDHCPARLNVATLNDAFELGALNWAVGGVASACVECGVCSYVCPARLPLSQRVRQLKRTLADLRQATPLFESAPAPARRT